MIAIGVIHESAKVAFVVPPAASAALNEGAAYIVSRARFGRQMRGERWLRHVRRSVVSGGSVHVAQPLTPDVLVSDGTTLKLTMQDGNPPLTHSRPNVFIARIGHCADRLAI